MVSTLIARASNQPVMALKRFESCHCLHTHSHCARLDGAPTASGFGRAKAKAKGKAQAKANARGGKRTKALGLEEF